MFFCHKTVRLICFWSYNMYKSNTNNTSCKVTKRKVQYFDVFMSQKTSILVTEKTFSKT